MCIREVQKSLYKSSAYWKGQIYQHVEKRALGLERALDINTHSLLPFIRLQRRRVVLPRTRLIPTHTSRAVYQSILQLFSYPG